MVFFSRAFLLVCIFIFWTISHLAIADTNVQRDTFLKAEKNVWQPDSPTYQALYKQLHFYPLQPYLDLRRLKDKIRLSDAEEIDSFLTQYKDTPLDWPLRKKWLYYLAKRHQKALFLKFYASNNDVVLNCTHMLYQLDAGMPEQTILPQVTKYWVVGKSQDKVCDPLFKKWSDAGYRTPDVIWQRLSLAADGGKHTLIPYLTSLLPKEQQYLGKLWHKVRRDPAYIIKLSRFSQFDEKETEIVTYGLKRLIWRDPDRALTIYHQAKQKFPFSQSQQDYLTGRFALALASKQHDKAADWLAQVDNEQLDNNLVQWKLANALKTEDWSKIKASLSTMPAHTKESTQWQYWYGRTLIELGDNTLGTDLLTQVANERHYYGFLAANQLALPINLNNKPLAVNEEQKQKLLVNPAAKRAFELFHIERFHQARLEWNYWLTQLSSSDKLVASAIAYEQGWFDRPIFTLAAQGYLDEVDMRFPMAYRDDIINYADKHKIEPSWAFAIARRESSFMRDAHSSAGARGLMQIMPQTAKQLAKRSISNHYLLDAQNNINLGTKYLKKLLDSNNGNKILATASYNAGPYRVKQWLTRFDKLPADIWIETIPFKETRDYVKSVLAYQQIYQHKLNSSAESPFTELVAMDISE
ncbi:transglycosylase SLT domain-containing protein [Colwellia sp. MEBiC06753]